VSTVAETIDRALAHRRAGQPGAAESLYRQVLEAEPENVAACSGLGAALRVQGNLPEAITCFERAVRLQPESAQARLDLGVALAESRRFDESAAQLEQALHLLPGSAAIEKGPRQSLGMLLNNLGIEFANVGKLDMAAACCRKAAELTPDEPSFHGNLGNVLTQQAKFDEAVACYRRVLELDDRAAPAYVGLGGIAMHRKQFAEAAARFRRALELDPGLVEFHHHLGIVLTEQGQYSEAEASFRRLLELQPRHAEGCNNLGVALAKQEKMSEAADWFRRSLQMRPNDAQTHYNLGNVLEVQNKLADAVLSFQRVLALNPDYEGAELALGLSLLASGRLREGWPHYESRWQTPELKDVRRYEPRWKGEDLAGGTILLSHDQGFGDAIQFVRYAELLQQRGAKVIVECAAPVARLLSTCPGVDDVVIVGKPLPAFDFALPLVSLPGVLGTTLETIPARVPYLRADAGLVERWRDELGHEPALKVAIAWHGRPSHPNDRIRSIPLSHFESIARTAGIRLYSIQVGHGREQLATIAKDWPIVDLGDKLGDFCDTAAVLCNCDLLITCDSAPAHLAGALGLPVSVALRFTPDWRWMLERDDSPWYPTIRLFRQTQRGDWGDVFERIAAELQSMLEANKQPR
jgi:tetratricopeptide (TPR) repeat protein